MGPQSVFGFSPVTHPNESQGCWPSDSLKDSHNLTYANYVCNILILCHIQVNKQNNIHTHNKDVNILGFVWSDGSILNPGQWHLVIDNHVREKILLPLMLHGGFLCHRPALINLWQHKHIQDRYKHTFTHSNSIWECYLHNHLNWPIMVTLYMGWISLTPSITQCLLSEWELKSLK